MTGVLLAVAAAAVTGLILGRSSAPSAAVVDPTVAAASTQTEGAADANWEIPTVEPADLRWVAVDLPRLRTSIPLSPVYGPARGETGQWGGWSQSPMGAVMAAWTIRAAWGFDNDAARAYLTEHTVTTEEYLSAGLSARSVDAPQVASRPTGFRVDGYSVATATVTLRTSSALPGGPLREAMTSMSLRWQDDDWKVVSTSQDHPRLSESVTGPFVPWGPQ